MEASIFKLDNVSQTVESLDVSKQNKTVNGVYTLFMCFKTESQMTTFFKCEQFSIMSI